MARSVSCRFLQEFVGPKAAEGFAARLVARGPQDVEQLLPLVLAAAGDDGAALSMVPPGLLDSDADPCYGGGGRSAPRPAWQQRGRGRQPWQAHGRRAPSAYNSGVHGWRLAARPRPPGGQMWRPPGASLQQHGADHQQQAVPQQQQMSCTPHGASTGTAWSRPWQAPASAAQGRMPGAAGEWQPDPVTPGKQVHHRPAVPPVSIGDICGAQSAEQQGAVVQVSPAASAGLQRPAPPPYRPPGW
jgi:hypothetical protein